MNDHLENSTLAVRTVGDNRQVFIDEPMIPSVAQDNPLLTHHYDNILEIYRKYRELKETFGRTTSTDLGDGPPSPICGRVPAVPRKENGDANDRTP